MKYLVDTNVISAVAPTRKPRPEAFVAWLDQRSDDLFISAVTAAEIRDGIAKARREGATTKAAMLQDWWDAVEFLYAGRILPFDLAAARIAGPMIDRARAGGHAPGFADIAIAGIAKSRDLTILTRNLRHFAPLGLQALDPFTANPD